MNPTSYKGAETDEAAHWYLTQGYKEAPFEQKIPTAEGLALYLGVSRQSIYNWREAHPSFREKLDMLKDWQCILLVNNGLDGSFSAPITKLMLAMNHGYTERTAIDHTSGGKTIKSGLAGFYAEADDDEET